MSAQSSSDGAPGGTAGEGGTAPGALPADASTGVASHPPVTGADAACCPDDCGATGRPRTSMQPVGPMYLNHLPPPLEVDLFRAARLGWVARVRELVSAEDAGSLLHTGYSEANGTVSMRPVHGRPTPAPPHPTATVTPGRCLTPRAWFFVPSWAVFFARP